MPTSWYSVGTMEKKGITLIGMPTSGKSTIGRVIAEKLEWPMLDVDRWMEEKMHMPLAQIIQTIGTEETLALETGCLTETNLRQIVVSTPGSVIYNDVYDALAAQTDIVWLNVALDEVERRLKTDPDPNRADQIIGIKQKGLAGLYAEREPLYRQWSAAGYVIDCASKDVPQIADEIIDTVMLRPIDPSNL